jgi:hypothetical protein
MTSSKKTWSVALTVTTICKLRIYSVKLIILPSIFRLYAKAQRIEFQFSVGCIYLYKSLYIKSIRFCVMNPSTFTYVNINKDNVYIVCTSISSQEQNWVNLAIVVVIIVLAISLLQVLACTFHATVELR